MNNRKRRIAALCLILLTIFIGASIQASASNLIPAGKLTATLTPKKYVYNGKARKPTVAVRHGKKLLKENRDYTLSWAKGRKNVGAYQVTIHLHGKYTGDIKKSFTVVPKGTQLREVKGGESSFQLVWNKQTHQADGYQVQYGTDKNFRSKTNTITISGTKKTSTKVKKLKNGAKYYVRVRTWKMAEKVRYVSAWSKSKSVKTKQTIMIRVNDNSFKTVLNDSKATQAFIKQLPLKVKMEELNGNEKYFYMNESLPATDSYPGTIHAGDLMLYDSNCLVLFYKSFKTSYPYTSLGKISDPAGLEKAVGKGAVTVTFSK